MALNIRNPEVERLASSLARLTGETTSEAVRRALEERLDRIERERSGRGLADDLDEVALACATLPVLDPRSADEILGYDADGVPGL